ncbi:hypothetical protein EYF80_014813 [Liparis tanakae]|uniref:Uncharacterized protein n=1 Tax=Liparis tanakae TaxID=230148 RepID=A0A4Z2IBR8_9TELE|nr:hypothetical protein EYF80_014813 [Liparis tanakae]
MLHGNNVHIGSMRAGRRGEGRCVPACLSVERRQRSHGEQLTRRWEELNRTQEDESKCPKQHKGNIEKTLEREPLREERHTVHGPTSIRSVDMWVLSRCDIRDTS